ncbi:HupE/UreJ family protein [Tropicimonas sp. IMCC6043]|uniref:HupE/UreJ family protein n=1 Tax=Tropicimonas sp. IMCC6043 TaxID=2510645 RepID=UPI00101C07B4|nr:HupE/UreJ family protein [Tropicimonas sp. IMCC6043]RYH09049.1 HupE/UreJ family protein [Tropicimonas sp. IMCC6043]
MILRRAALALLLLLGSLAEVSGHALQPGYLDLRQLTADTWQVFWRKPDVNGAPMAIDAALPDSCMPAVGPDPAFDGSAWVSAWVADCPGGLGGREIAIPGLELQRTDVLVRLQPHDRSATTQRLTPEAPSHVLPETPSTWGVFQSYFRLGFAHILEGLDHLLFVFALIILVRDRWRLIGAITAFTVAHSITLALAALGRISVPGPPVEATIALSIVFLAVEILKHEDGALRLSERAPWLVSFAFGLLHGLGFAGALTEIGLPEGEIPAALLAFNLGVEGGQLAFVAAVLAAGAALRLAVPRVLAQARRAHSAGSMLTGYAIGGTATYWLVQRVIAF